MEFSRVSKAYPVRGGGEVLALEALDFVVMDGEFVSVVGRSGCGKSTLLRILAGLIKPTSGSVHLWGDVLEGPRSDVGMVFQSPVLLPWRTVMENVVLPLQVERRLDSAGRRLAMELLRQVGLDGFEDRHPFELSGGMQQRVSLARLLVRDPALLLMDEPFGALDALTREQLNLSLQDIWLTARKSVLFVTHSIAEAVFLGDRVVVLSPRPGRVVGDVDIYLPRPRSIDLMTTRSFGDAVQRVRRLLDAPADSRGAREQSNEERTL